MQAVCAGCQHAVVSSDTAFGKEACLLTLGLFLPSFLFVYFTSVHCRLSQGNRILLRLTGPYYGICSRQGNSDRNTVAAELAFVVRKPSGLLVTGVGLRQKKSKQCSLTCLFFFNKTLYTHTGVRAVVCSFSLLLFSAASQFSWVEEEPWWI